MIRGIEPVQGIEVTMKNRETKNFHILTNDLGKLIKTLAITKELNGVYATDTKSELTVIEGEEKNLRFFLLIESG